MLNTSHYYYVDASLDWCRYNMFYWRSEHKWLILPPSASEVTFKKWKTLLYLCPGYEKSSHWN